MIVRSSFNPNETNLLRLCRTRTWDAVLERSKSHPLEAMPTDSARRGESSTALSVAVRSRAPRQVIENLLRADWNQVGVTHMARGSLLHEAFKHQVPDDCLHGLIEAAIQYERVSRYHRDDSDPFQLLGHKDEIGRTALHYMVDRAVRALDMGDGSRSYWSSLLLLAQAYPYAAQEMDADGNTPLILLLLTPKFVSDSGGLELEAELFRIVQLLVSVCPEAVAVSRHLPQPWHYQRQIETTGTSFVHGDGVPTPLSCALLHGRSSDTIDILLNANRKLGCMTCRTIVTHYREVPLHIAVSMRAPCRLISKLLQEEREVIGVGDIYGLIPLDWMWIRHVYDWFSSPSGDNLAPVMVSRRRHLANNFLVWHGRVSRQYLGIEVDLEESKNIQVREWTRRLKEDLFQRMTTMLPAMAAHCYKNSTESDRMDEGIDDGIQERWTLLHAACFVSCPLSMVKVALQSSSQEIVRSLDSIHGRLPLHFAAGRGGGYTATFPIGVACSLHVVQEPSPVELVLSSFPSACQERDGYNQLPLHIAIDAAKEIRRRGSQHPSTVHPWANRNQEENCDKSASFDEDVELLLRHYPDGLECQDGVTKLYPFMQAAEGKGSSLNTVYTLLRRNPMLVKVSVM
jgi:hypothetical protein